MASTSIFVGLVISIMLSSFVIAMAIQAKENESVSYVLGPYVTDIRSELNFTKNCDSFKGDSILITFGNWTCNNLGLISDSSKFSRFYLIHSVAEGNFYNTTYYINNTLKNDFQIIVRQGGYNHYYDDIIIEFNSDRIRIINNILNILSDIEVVYPNSDYNKFVINTKYDYVNNYLTLTINGIKILVNYRTNAVLVGGADAVAGFGGVGSDGGLIVENIVSKTNIASTSIDTSILGSINSIWGLVISIVFWTVDPKYLPLWANLMFIKTQVAGVIISGLAILRGV